MAQYSHLPLFAKTYEFTKSVYRLVRQFRKEYKFTIGSELQSIIWEILDRVIEANSVPNCQKEAHIDRISNLFDRFKIRLRFSQELGLISADKFGGIQNDLGEIGQMIGGWKKWAGKTGK